MQLDEININLLKNKADGNNEFGFGYVAIDEARTHIKKFMDIQNKGLVYYERCETQDNKQVIIKGKIL